MFHLLAYEQTTTATDVNVDMLAITDPVFSQRNNHFIFSEQYQFLALAAMGANLTDARINMPSINSISRHHVFPINAAATPASYPRFQDFRSNPVMIPVNEELAFEESDTAIEQATVHPLIAPPSWNRTLPPASMANPRLLIKFTATVTRIAKAWSGPFAIVFEQTPKGGWYCANACYVNSSNARAFRLFFPRAQLVNGRILRPGWLANNATGNLIAPYLADGLGEWGRFHTFEPPQIEEYADAAGADAITGFLDITYLGTTPNY